MEAFAQHEAGVSLAILQTLFSDVAVELSQMIEAEHALKEGKVVMQPSRELGRKIVAAIDLRQKQNQKSIFMAGFWRLAAPVGIATLSFMFILSSRQTIRPEPVVEDQGSLFAVQEAAPMMAKNAAVSLMAVETPAADSFALMADDGADTAPEESSTDALYLWQMIALGLLTILSIIVLIKHWQVRRRAL